MPLGARACQPSAWRHGPRPGHQANPDQAWILARLVRLTDGRSRFPRFAWTSPAKPISSRTSAVTGASTGFRRRFRGLHTVPRAMSAAVARDRRLRGILCGAGLQETCTFSFLERQAAEPFLPAGGRACRHRESPLGEVRRAAAVAPAGAARRARLQPPTGNRRCPAVRSGRDLPPGWRSQSASAGC